MAYDAQYIDGFDKYGPIGYVDTATEILKEWNTNNTTLGIVGPLSGTTGTALRVSSGVSTDLSLNMGCGGNYARVIGGATVAPTLGGQFRGVLFGDGAWHLSIGFNNSGNIVVYRGLFGSTILATSTESISTESVHCLEWDITFNNTLGIVKVWLDGNLTSINLSNQDTINSVNPYMNTFALYIKATNGTTNWIDFDHLYLWFFIATGGAETPALTNPIIETSFGVSDSAVQFTPTAGVLGTVARVTTTTSAPVANSLLLRKYTAKTNSTINSVAIIPGATSAAAKFQPVIYSDSAGAPNTLLSTGAEVVGATSGTIMILTLTTAQALTAGTQYWIGYITNTSVLMQLSDTLLLGYRAANTYTSGAPGTAPAMTSAQASFLIYGNCTVLGNNFSQINENPGLGDKSYNQSSTVGHEDLYNFDPLVSTPSVIYTAAIKALVARSDAGARTVDLRTKSGVTSSSGDITGLSPATSYGFLGSHFDIDPDTGVAWGASGLNSAKHGLKIAS